MLFKTLLQDSMQQWRHRGKRGVWLKVPPLPPSPPPQTIWASTPPSTTVRIAKRSGCVV